MKHKKKPTIYRIEVKPDGSIEAVSVESINTELLEVCKRALNKFKWLQKNYVTLSSIPFDMQIESIKTVLKQAIEKAAEVK